MAGYGGGAATEIAHLETSLPGVTSTGHKRYPDGFGAAGDMGALAITSRGEEGGNLTVITLDNL